MRTFTATLVLLGVGLTSCGESRDPAPTTSDAPKARLRVEYYEISKK